MYKFIRTSERPEVMDRDGTFHANCNSWMLVNQGNTVVTIEGTWVLKPGESFSSQYDHPEVLCATKWAIVFDRQTDPKGFAVVPGAETVQAVYTPGDPAPKKDNRLIVLRWQIKEK